jgi:signal transduction histidine kinase
MSRFGFGRVDRITAQMAIVMMASLMLVHVVTAVGFFVTRDSWEPRGDHPDQIAAIARMLDVTPSDRRPALLADVSRAFPRMDVRMATDAEADGVRWDGPEIPSPPPLRGTSLKRGRLMDPAPSASFRMAFRLADGAVVVAPPPHRPPMGLFGPFTQSVLLIGLSAVLLAWWATASITRPLRAFEEAVQRFSENIEERALPERGPREIRTAARALNRMQARIKMLINDRTRVLAALSHDLRTPLTRLRLRAEFISDEAMRQSTLGDIAQMQSMVDAALVYLRDGIKRPVFARIDIATILQGVCGEFADIGKEAVYDGPDHVVILGAFDSLHRALTNLVDNAIRYGGCARVGLAEQADHIEIVVADDGPGIAGELKAAVLEPFVRGDAARRMDATSGFGLGLPIAKSVIESHGGRMELADGSAGGLVVRIWLPKGTTEITAGMPLRHPVREGGQDHGF